VSTPGTLSAKNSTVYMNTAAAITTGSVSGSSPGGRVMEPVAPRIPSMAMAAYMLIPLAHATPMPSAMTCTRSMLSSECCNPLGLSSIRHARGAEFQ